MNIKFRFNKDVTNHLILFLKKFGIKNIMEYIYLIDRYSLVTSGRVITGYNNSHIDTNIVGEPDLDYFSINDLKSIIHIIDKYKDSEVQELVSKLPKDYESYFINNPDAKDGAYEIMIDGQEDRDFEEYLG